MAVDIGGTKLAAGLVSRSGELTDPAHVATDADRVSGAEELWRHLAALVEGLTRLAPPGALRVCVHLQRRII